MSFGEKQGEITVDLGNEPDVFPCDRWGVYVTFEFGRARPDGEPSPLDPLKAVSLKRIGHCL